MGDARDRVGVITADITTLQVDAIVNAANSSLLGGGEVDGAIHRAAGPGLVAHCRSLGGCATGQAKATPGFGLPAANVIHTVGPVWKGGGAGEAAQLAACYRNALALAAAEGWRSLAFPAISTGVYRFPPALAARIAVDTVLEILNNAQAIDQVIFCCFSDASADLHRSALAQVAA